MDNTPATYEWDQQIVEPQQQLNRTHAGCNIRQLSTSPHMRFVSLPYGASTAGGVWFGELIVTGAHAHVDALADECAEHLATLRAHYASTALVETDA